MVPSPLPPCGGGIRVPLLLALFVAVASCGGGAVEGHSRGPELNADPTDPVVFGEVPEFHFQNQAGTEVTRADFLGHPFAVAAIFTRCAGPCPRISSRMRTLQGALAHTDVHLVSVSVDPSFDRPAVLAAYAERYSADPERWSFLTGTEADVEAFLKDGLWLPLARAEAGGDAGTRVTHSTKVVAIDRKGRIRGWYDVLDEEQAGRLEDRLRALAAE